MINKNLVLLSYGRESEYKRAIFCILSFWAWGDTLLKNFRLVIYTDQPDFFKPFLKDLNVVYVNLTHELTEEMLAGSPYTHRRKVAVIDMTFRDFPGEDLVFIDSDTFFITNPALMLTGFEVGRSYMHKREYLLKDGVALFTSFNQGKYPQAFLNYIGSKTFDVGGIEEHFTEADYSWNSGVLALHNSFAGYMPDVYRLTDEFYANSEWFISEQLAFALILQKRTEISSAEHFVLHYWGAQQKVLLDGLLDEFFINKNSKDLMDRTYIKSLTKKWEKAVEADLIIEQINIAREQRDLVYGLKQSIKLILKNPFNTDIYIKLFKI